VGESESEKSDLTKRHQKTGIKKNNHTPHTGNAKGMAKKQQQKQNHQTHY
jgi:hypothetical protein